ncbi:hypothetical protein [Nocardioides sambongensis]|uniref:hypothetical protein n=1 Tax=Nocardioides sambongensis TaxID=2589074 RepID=UPI001128F2FA|nr:hypothetical protein [Nocardioides sambongensis]
MADQVRERYDLDVRGLEGVGGVESELGRVAEERAKAAKDAAEAARLAEEADRADQQAQAAADREPDDRHSAGHEGTDVDPGDRVQDVKETDEPGTAAADKEAHQNERDDLDKKAGTLGLS